MLNGRGNPIANWTKDLNDACDLLRDKVMTGTWDRWVAQALLLAAIYDVRKLWATATDIMALPNPFPATDAFELIVDSIPQALPCTDDYACVGWNRIEAAANSPVIPAASEEPTYRDGEDKAWDDVEWGKPYSVWAAEQKIDKAMEKARAEREAMVAQAKATVQARKLARAIRWDDGRCGVRLPWDNA